MRYIVRARATLDSAAAASTIAREWVQQHGGRAVVLEGRGPLRLLVDRYGFRRWWWSR